jgi:hypothetical protein
LPHRYNIPRFNTHALNRQYRESNPSGYAIGAAPAMG